MVKSQGIIDYEKYLKNLRDVASEQHTKMADAQDLIKKGVVTVARNLKSMGLPISDIKKATGLSDEKIEKL